MLPAQKCPHMKPFILRQRFPPSEHNLRITALWVVDGIFINTNTTAVSQPIHVRLLRLLASENH